MPAFFLPAAGAGRATRRTLTAHPSQDWETTMSKKTSKRATRRKKGANHGKRPNGN
jgi:hypothetical protein